jgi:hypothetical protein
LFKEQRYVDSEFNSFMTEFSLSPLDYIIASLKLICQTLQLPFNITQSSQLHLPSGLKGQDRIIAIAKHFNANTYINSPGGRDIYDSDDFKKNNLELKFLSDYKGSYQSILPRLFSENTSDLRNEIIYQTEVT